MGEDVLPAKKLGTQGWKRGEKRGRGRGRGGERKGEREQRGFLPFDKNIFQTTGG